MNRRVWLSSLALIVVAGLSLSGAYARQVWSESQAHAQYVTTQAAVNRALSHAASVGLLPRELAPLQGKVRAVIAGRPPSSVPFWSSASASYYDRQTAALRLISTEIQSMVHRVTRQTRKKAKAQLRELARAMDQAHAVDVDVTAAEPVLTGQRHQLHMSTTPRQYRSIMSAAREATQALRASISVRQGYIHDVLGTAGGQQAGVVNLAQSEATAEDKKLGLLGLFTSRAGQDRSTLERLVQAVRAQQTAFGAAVKEYHVHDEVAQIDRDYAKTVPYKMVVVSTEKQWAWMYQGGTQVNDTPVTTGGPELPTDHGIFHIYMKVSPFTFHSPWPAGSPYYYPPTPIQYWMPFDGGEGLHDAWWRSNFGPGSNLQPTDLGTGNYILGTHGCVNMPLDIAAFIWNWAPVGTTVVVI